MPKNIAVVVADFHKKEGIEMLEEVREFAKQNELHILVEKWVPGSMEQPLALKRVLMDDRIDGAVALGIIERGETRHGFVMGQAVITAIIGLQLELMKPIGLGIIGPDVLPSQIPSRVRPHALRAVQAVAREME